MEQVKEFLLLYWKEIAALVLWLISTIILLCKKRVKVTDVLDLVLQAVPKLIQTAEEKFEGSQGPLKKEFVLESCYSMIASLSSLSREDIIARYSNTLSVVIEDILACPVKKIRR